MNGNVQRSTPSPAKVLARFPSTGLVNFNGGNRIIDGVNQNAKSAFEHGQHVDEQLIPTLLYVIVKKDGGGSGDDCVAASHTYSIYDKDDTGFLNVLATGVSVAPYADGLAREFPCEYIPADDGSPAIAGINSDGTYILFDVRERPKTDCDEDA